MDNEIKEDDLIFGDAMLLPNEDENWKFILADRTYTLDAPTEVIISRMLNQLLAEQAKNKKLVEALEEIRWYKAIGKDVHKIQQIAAHAVTGIDVLENGLRGARGKQCKITTLTL